MESGIRRYAVASGATVTPRVWVRKSVVGDGAAYNGNQPRLLVRENISGGIAVDTVLATAVAAAGTWEELSGATVAVTDSTAVEIIVDCDGTAGWIDNDDWA